MCICGLAEVSFDIGYHADAGSEQPPPLVAMGARQSVTRPMVVTRFPGLTCSLRMFWMLINGVGSLGGAAALGANPDILTFHQWVVLDVLDGCL